MKRTILLTVFAALGLALALGLTARPASAWDVAHLPAGFTTLHTISNGPCGDMVTIFGYGSASAGLCTDSPSFQQDVDGFVDAHCPVTVCVPPVASTTVATTDPVAVTTPAAPAPTTTAQTTTVYVTTAAAPLPPVTTTVQADPLPAVTVSTPAVTPEVRTVTETVVQTVTVPAVAVAVPDEPWLAALAVRSVALNVVYGLV